MFKAAPSGRSADDQQTAGMTDAASAGGASYPSLLDRPQATWRLVLTLALPVLAQQLLILSVGISDRILAGRLEPMPPKELAEGVGHRLLALGHFGNGLTTGTWVSALAAEVPWEMARQIGARHIAYQAAQTTAIYLTWLVASFTVLVSVGGTALVARFVGAGDRESAIRVANQSVLLALALGLLATAVGLLGLDTFIWLLQLRGPAAALAADYLKPLICLMVFQVMEAAGIACLVGAGDTRTSFCVLGGVAILNLPLAWGLFLGIGPLPELRFVGIALGTAISHTLGGLAVLVILAHGRAGLRLHWRLLQPDWGLARRLLRISVPAGVDSLFIILGHLWFLSIVNRLGETASSAHGIGLCWEALAFSSGVAFGTAAMTLVGQNLGAGRPTQAARSGWTAFGMGCGAMCLMGAVFFILAPEMFALFCPYPEQRAIIDVGVPVLRLEAFAEPALASVVIFLYALRGAGDTRVPVLLNCLGLFGVRVPLAFILTLKEVDLGDWGHWSGFGLGLFGAWSAMVADLVVRGILFFHRFAGQRWQRIRV